MENSINYDFQNIDNPYFNFSFDKDPTMHNIDLFGYQPNFDFNEPIDKNIIINNIIGLPTKETMNIKKAKDEMNHIKDKTNVNNEPINKKEKINKKGKNFLLGRKKREDLGSGKHNKFCDDNLRKKCKHLVLDNTFNFINDKIKEMYNGNLGKGMFVKKLLILNQKQKSEASIQYNKDFMKKSLVEIFSEEISSRYTIHHPSHNYFLIKALSNEKDKNKKNYFTKLFSITFIDCLKHFIGSKKIEELEGLKTFENVKEKYEDDEDYLKSLEYCIMNYEDIINNKRTRIRKENKKE